MDCLSGSGVKRPEADRATWGNQGSTATEDQLVETKVEGTGAEAEEVSERAGSSTEIKAKAPANEATSLVIWQYNYAYEE